MLGKKRYEYSGVAIFKIVKKMDIFIRILCIKIFKLFVKVYKVCQSARMLPENCIYLLKN